MHAGDLAGARRQFDGVPAADGKGGSWSAYAALGKIQLADREKDYQAIDAQAADFARHFSASPLRSRSQAAARPVAAGSQGICRSDRRIRAAGGRGGQPRGRWR